MFKRMEDWGNAFWRTLHLMAATHKTKQCNNDMIFNFISAFIMLLPCEQCRSKAQNILDVAAEAELNIALKDNEFLEWTIMFHNAVNMSLGKPIVPVQETAKLYMSSLS